MATTLAQLVDEIQTLFDVSGSTAFQASEWNRIANDGYRALWADVVGANPNFRVNTATFTITTGQSQALPADYAETVYVRRDPGLETQVYLDAFGARDGSRAWDNTYRISNASLIIEPLARAPGNFAHDYIPQPPTLAGPAPGPQVDMDPELDQWRLYVVYYGVLQAIGHDNTDGNAFFRLLYGTPDGNEPGLRKQVMRWAAGKRTKDPGRIEDVRGRRGWLPLPR